jgi:Raf kinase inhibitor-like YbhB/YbcL family protein
VRAAVIACISLLTWAAAASGAPSFRFTDASDVHAGKPIAKRFTCDGADVAPNVVWRGVPKKAKELALVLEDPDAPGGTFTHWLTYGMSPSTTEWGRPGWSAYPPGGAAPRAGRNDFGKLGYGGPCPPHGQTHHYMFRLLALDARLKLSRGAERSAFDRAVAHHVLAQARLVATYARH